MLVSEAWKGTVRCGECENLLTNLVICSNLAIFSQMFFAEDGKNKFRGKLDVLCRIGTLPNCAIVPIFALLACLNTVLCKTAFRGYRLQLQV